MAVKVFLSIFFCENNHFLAFAYRTCSWLCALHIAFICVFTKNTDIYKIKYLTNSKKYLTKTTYNGLKLWKLGIHI